MNRSSRSTGPYWMLGMKEGPQSMTFRQTSVPKPSSTQPWNWSTRARPQVGYPAGPLLASARTMSMVRLLGMPAAMAVPKLKAPGTALMVTSPLKSGRATPLRQPVTR